MLVKVNLIHIAQSHQYPFKEEFATFPLQRQQKIMNEVILSQLKVARAIKQHIGCPVVVEGSELNINSCHTQNSIKIKEIFPLGIPQTCDELSQAQKMALYDDGAAHILLYLGDIPMIYRSIKQNGEVAQKIHSIFRVQSDIKVRDAHIENLRVDREKEAIACVKEAFLDDLQKKKSVPDRIASTKIILVYGVQHNFQPYCHEKKEAEESNDLQISLELDVIDCSVNDSENTQQKHQPLGCSILHFALHHPHACRAIMVSFAVAIVLALLLTTAGVGLGVTVASSTGAGLFSGVSTFFISKFATESINLSTSPTLS